MARIESKRRIKSTGSNEIGGTLRNQVGARETAKCRLFMHVSVDGWALEVCFCRPRDAQLIAAGSTYEELACCFG